MSLTFKDTAIRQSIQGCSIDLRLRLMYDACLYFIYKILKIRNNSKSETKVVRN